MPNPCDGLIPILIIWGIIGFIVAVFYRSWGIAFFTGALCVFIASWQFSCLIRIWLWILAGILVVVTSFFFIRDYRAAKRKEQKEEAEKEVIVVRNPLEITPTKKHSIFNKFNQKGLTFSIPAFIL